MQTSNLRQSNTGLQNVEKSTSLDGPGADSDRSVYRDCKDAFFGVESGSGAQAAEALREEKKRAAEEAAKKAKAAEEARKAEEAKKVPLFRCLLEIRADGSPWPTNAGQSDDSSESQSSK